MSIWKDQGTARNPSVPASPEPTPFRDVATPATPPPVSTLDSAPVSAPTAVPASVPAARQAQGNEPKESLIAADISIEGKIEGSGHVRIAGRFKGDVNVKGDLTIEHGAKLNGGVRARKVVIAGELEGNIEGAERVELLASGALIGDVKAGSLTVAAGSKMRGNADFGWEDKASGNSSGGSAGSGSGGKPGKQDTETGTGA